MIPPKTFAVERNLGYQNLIVGGCSFTHNFLKDHIHTWPYYLRDLGGFNCVYDTSCPGAGNNHIQRSIINCIDENNLSAANSLVVVMWSGYDRDDFLVDPKTCNTQDELNNYFYNKQVSLGLTGGLLGDSNLLVSVENIKKIKNHASRALENYIAIRSLETFLKAQNFQFAFCEFSTPGHMKDTNFDPVPLLSKNLQKTFSTLVRTIKPNLGDWALSTIQRNNGDGYHPDADHHLTWTRNVLLPVLPAINCIP